MMPPYWCHCWQTVKLYWDEGIFGAMLCVHTNSILLKEGSFFTNSNYITQFLHFNPYILVKQRELKMVVVPLFLSHIHMWASIYMGTLRLKIAVYIENACNVWLVEQKRSKMEKEQESAWLVKMVGVSPRNCACCSMDTCGSFCCGHG
jgi:hypothetical protein